ncbi:dipeptide ABC transporter ATP-binding protein DppD [Falsiroseomonas bella]|uniref:Dipeptide ABC transporter ATP-binding protein DppD n=1 Tax=Falsiroseomonas bella TaxID=2184016 RepID=A0A317FF76_9PROT|nr:ABC transporter ATP-binding protein [Falsiroseomonas bella]PWS37425.1 dipeptide ABC transporter ATP-binding protein DppD [Falsiroseomonas bella]
MSAVELQGLNVTFTGGTKPVRAVRGVDLGVDRGETVALLGESGSGKSVTLRALLRLNPERKSRIEGSIRVAGQDVMALRGRALEDFRGKVASMIFQEPSLALDPVYTLGAQIAETVVKHEGGSRAAGWARALELFRRVRIPEPERRLNAYPHEMSGGMRQRAMIALALACRPQVLLADEPTTALDATVQIQVLLLLRELQREFGLATIFVTHDIGVAVEVADRIAVMYAGRIVETGPVREIIRNPRHPYTIGLLRARMGHEQRRGARLEAIPGAPPDLSALPPGCAFAPRCRFAEPVCSVQDPAEEAVAPQHLVRCLRSAATLAPAG